MILYVLRAVKNILYNHQNLIQSIKTFAEDLKKFYLGIMTLQTILSSFLCKLE